MIFRKSIFKITFFIILNIFSQEIKGQIISISNLFKSYSLNRDEIENLMIIKGYAYYGTQVLSKDYRIIHYYHKNKAIFHSMSFTYFDNNQLVEVDFTTSIQQEYVVLKTQIKERGYLFNTSYDVSDKFVKYIYKNSKYSEYLVQTHQSFVSETGDNNYSVSVKKEPDYIKAMKGNR
jgi:O-glycosyl hydrolase